jgi:hypothetical protein
MVCIVLRRGKCFLKINTGHPYPDIDISIPELNCDARSREFERKNSKPTDRVVPSNCKATIILTSAQLKLKREGGHTATDLRSGQHK